VTETDAATSSWVVRLLKAARSGAPALRTLLTASVELRVIFGTTREVAQGATIVSEWLAGRFAAAQHFEVVAHAVKGSRVLAQIHIGSDAAYPAAWHLEATLTRDGAATEIALRTQGLA